MTAGKALESDLDPAMTEIRKLFADSGLSLEDLGVLMGYPRKSARKSAWQFLNQTADPRVSMVRKFAAALDVGIERIVGS